MRRQTAIAFTVLFGIMLPFMLFSTPATSTGGTTGTISQNVLSATEGSTFVLQMSDLETGADYSIEIDDTAEFNWTTGDSETARTYRFTVPAGGDDNQVKIELVNAGSTVLDVLYLQVGTAASLVPTTLVQGVYIAMIGLFIFAAILIAIKKGLI